MSLYSNRELAERAEACLNEGRGLTQWERNFLEDLHDKLTQNSPISEREKAKLIQIHIERVEEV